MNISEKMKNIANQLKKFLLCQKEFKTENEEINMKIFSYIKENDIEGVKFEVENGLNFEIFDESGRTPLLYAVKRKNLEAAEILLQNGAKVNNHDNAGLAPIHYAIFADNFDMLKLLQKFDANLDEKTSVNEFTPLMIAVNEGNSEIFKFLLENGANVHMQNQHGNTALIWSIMEGIPENVKLALDYGASPFLENMDGYNAFQYSEFFPNEQIVALLGQFKVIHDLPQEDEVQTVAEEFESCDDFIE